MAGKIWIRGIYLILASIWAGSCQTIQPFASDLPTRISSEPGPEQPELQFTQTPQPTQTPDLITRNTPTILPSSPTAKVTITHTASFTQEPFFSGPQEIGISVGGSPIEIYRFGTGPTQRLILAGIHGGYEWNTIKLARQMIEEIKANPSLIPARITLHIVPSLNPDGETRGHGPQGRANDNGVDLNRNFPVNWKVDWPRTGCWQLGQISAGENPLSESESTALANFILTHPVDGLISYHSAGLGIFPGGYPEDLVSIDLAKTLADVSPFPYPPIHTGCEHTGTLVDYASELGIAAVDLELSTHWDPELETNLGILQAFLNWNFKSDPNAPQPIP